MPSEKPFNGFPVSVLPLFGLSLLALLGSGLASGQIPPAIFSLSSSPFLCGLWFGLAVVGMGLCPGPKERGFLVFLCAGSEALRVYQDWQPAFIGVLAFTGPRCALVALVHGLISAIFRPHLRRRLRLGLAHSLTLPFLYLAGDTLLSLYAKKAGLTYDLFYYAADLTLGPPWCFQVVSWTHQSFAFYVLGNLAYFFLSHIMAFTSAIWILRPKGPNPNLYFFVCAVICGNVGYLLMSGVGPEVVFQGRFPFDPPTSVPLQMILVPANYPRNTMPSLHLLWAYSIWIALAVQGAYWFRASLTYLVVMPVVAFLGRHYLVDYIPSLCVAPALHLGVIALTYRNRPPLLLAGMAALGLIFAPAYFCFVVFGSSIWQVWPWLLKMCTVGLAVLAVFSGCRLKQYLQNLTDP